MCISTFGFYSEDIQVCCFFPVKKAGPRRWWFGGLGLERECVKYESQSLSFSGNVRKPPTKTKIITISVGGIPNSKEVCIYKVDINYHLFFWELVDNN